MLESIIQVPIPSPNADERVQAWLESQAKTGINGVDYFLIDRSDGRGPQIAQWDTVVLGPPPTTVQLSALTAQANAIAAARQLQATLARVDPTLAAGLTELVAVLIAKGALSRTDLSANLLNVINARRALLGLSAL